MDKAYRQRAIRKILESRQVGRQDELASLLKAEGISATQATLSRDLKEMRVIRMHNLAGDFVYMLPGRASRQTRSGQGSIQDGDLGSGILKVDFSGNLGVVKTRPGYANVVASVIDNSDSKEVIGTIAGDDTILLILKVSSTPTRVLEELSVLFHGGSN